MSETKPTANQVVLEHLKTFLLFLWHYIKIFFSKAKAVIGKIAAREKTINQNFREYHKGAIQPTDLAYKEYQEAIFKNRLAGFTFKAFISIYYRYLRPKYKDDGFLGKTEILQLITTPQDYILITKTEYQRKIEESAQNQLEELTTKKDYMLITKAEYQRKIEESVQSQLEELTAEKVKAIKDDLIQKLLPFVSHQEEGDEPFIDYFAQKDANRIKYYAQRKKIEELEERERKAGIKEEKLSLQQMMLDNEYKLLAVEMKNREIEHKIKMLELMTLSLELQRKTNDLEIFKKELQIMQDLHNLEIKSRENLLAHGQQLLQLKEQGLENQLALQEAEFIRQQTNTDKLRIEIENKLLQLRESEFSHKAKEMLLEIREKSSQLKIQEGKIDLKQLLQKKQDYEYDIELLGDIMSTRKQIVLTLEGEMTERKEKIRQTLKSVNEHKQLEELKRSQMFQDIYYDGV